MDPVSRFFSPAPSSPSVFFLPSIRRRMQALLQGVAEWCVRPHVGKTFSLAQAGEAQAYVEARRNGGKVVLPI